MTKDEYLNLVKAIEGETLLSVEYFEIDYGGPQTDFTEKSDYDCLDFGVNLKMLSGKIFGLIWGSEFLQYGVSVLEAPIQSEVNEYRQIDVTHSSNWSQIVGNEVRDAYVVWHWEKEVGPFKKKTYYPQSIALKFKSSQIVIISALEIEHNRHWGMADNIVVFFSQASANKFGVMNELDVKK